MDKDLCESDCQTIQENDIERSLVDKFKKNVTEIISNTPLSKWFGKQNVTPNSSVRRRQDDSDDEQDFQKLQPPTKRTKLPPTKETLSLNVSETLSPISSVNNVKNSIYMNFPEPLPGPSGYQTRQMLNSTSFTTENNLKSGKIFSENTDNLFKNPQMLVTTSEISNINKDFQSDSEESTSGYSSGRIGSKEIVSQESSKQTSYMDNSPKKTRSLFQDTSSRHSLMSDRTLSPSRNSSLSTRMMPSFNPSSFGSSNFVDRTLSTKRILDSPFYNGNTIYGGASAYGRNSKRAPQDMRKVLRQSVSIKPINRGMEKGDLQLGKTARRILDTLEQYSSPVSDAKKIPVPSKRFRSEGSLAKYIGANPYSVRDSRGASNKELQVPSVTELLKMKIDQQKTRLQDSTEAVRQIAAKSKSILNEKSYQIPVQRENDRHTGKIKTKISSVRQKMQFYESVPEVELNPVSLPIKELPKFDIIVKPPTEKFESTLSSSDELKGQLKTTPSVNKPSEQRIVTKSNGNNIHAIELDKNAKTLCSSKKDAMEFRFSPPLILAEYLKPLKALNNFKFSEPLVKKRRSIHPELDSQENKLVDNVKPSKYNGESSLLSNTNRHTNMSNNSLMDQFKPKEGTWECSVCMIRNQANITKCVACETSRSPGNQDGNKLVASDKSNSFTFDDKFKVPSDTWECTSCLIRNKNNISKCMACKTQKPGSSASKAVSVSASTIKLSDHLAPPNTWECSVCMIRNKNELMKCAACESAKPGTESQTAIGSFGVEFRKKESEWECEVCMVRNKCISTKCQCCESLKPGASSVSASSETKTTKVSLFNFGIDKNTATGFTFGIPPDVQANQSIDKTNAQLVFGEKRDETKTKGGTPSFTFGIPANNNNLTKLPENKPAVAFDPSQTTEKDANKKTTNSFSLGGPPKKEVGENKTTPSFSFGAPLEIKNKTEDKSLKDETSGKIGKEVEKVNPLLKPNEKLPEKAPVATSESKFHSKGVPNTSMSSTSANLDTDGSPSKKPNPASGQSETSKLPISTFKESIINGDINKTSPFSKANLENKSPRFGCNVDPLKTTTPASAIIMPFENTTPKPDTSKTAAQFKFGSSSSEESKQTNGFCFTPPGKPSFGAKEATKNNSEASPFSLARSSSMTSGKTPSFTTATTKTPVFQFGLATSESKSHTSPSFSFNTPAPENKSGSTSFSFGNPTTTKSNINSSSESRSDFSFGTGTIPTPFGSAVAKNETVFGAPPSQSAAANGTFNFGSGGTSTQKAGFTFGSFSGNTSVTTASTGGFNFGSASTTTPAASGGFNFSPAPSFDANAKPLFNFTGGAGITGFSAPPQAGAVPQRKMKKAIRRAVR